MAARIDEDTIENVCLLAKLSLSDQEKKEAIEDMQKMLDYVDKLNELDTEHTEPLITFSVRENVFREDIPAEYDHRSEILAEAPKVKNNQYLVPKTIG